MHAACEGMLVQLIIYIVPVLFIEDSWKYNSTNINDYNVKPPLNANSSLDETDSTKSFQFLHSTYSTMYVHTYLYLTRFCNDIKLVN